MKVRCKAYRCCSQKPCPHRDIHEKGDPCVSLCVFNDTGIPVRPCLPVRQKKRAKKGRKP